jgi:plasmid maintenance system killer protein
VRIVFTSRKVQRTCESRTELERRFGSRMGRLLASRLNELEAAPTLAAAMAVPHLKLHQLRADRDEQFALSLVEPHRLILEVAHDPLPRGSDGGIDLVAVTEIVLVEIVDYH